MELISGKELAKAASMKGIGGELFSKFIMQALSLDKVNKVYAKQSGKSGLDFINGLIKDIGIRFEIDEADLKRIPSKGAFISVSNHPLGGADGILLLKILKDVRPDAKVLVNYLLQRIKPMADSLIAINPFEEQEDKSVNVKGLKMALKQLQDGSPIGIFPAGEVSTFQLSKKKIADREWQPAAIRFIRKAEVPVVPIYFDGVNSKLYYLLAQIHPVLRTAKLPSELFSKKKRTIKIRIGHPISVKEQAQFTDLDQYGRFLRAKTYSLGSRIEDVSTFFRPSLLVPKMLKKKEVIAAAGALEELYNEVDRLKKKHVLFEFKNYDVLCAPAASMPKLMHEIGRQREITFRAVGEGTNRGLDLDEYDLYYHQLFIWDNEAKALVGAYRVGKGKDIYNLYGSKGFYIRSLFNTDARFDNIFSQSLELGRSFIVKEYQRKPLSLFLLWKGILYFLLKNPDYRYLIGPVSISNDFSSLSKNLIVSFVRSNCFNHELATWVKPIKEFRPNWQKDIDSELIVKHNDGDLERLDKAIQDIEKHLKLPILLKKYFSLNAKILGFNIDPKFNNCLDGFLMLDIFDIPHDFLDSLSKELNDKSMVERFQNQKITA